MMGKSGLGILAVIGTLGALDATNARLGLGVIALSGCVVGIYHSFFHSTNNSKFASARMRTSNREKDSSMV